VGTFEGTVEGSGVGFPSKYVGANDGEADGAGVVLPGR